ncbi:nuclear matrix constituent protein 1b-like [Hordeum vulgare subsp. vulgare]|uniref:Protein CROWDED NUCLEI 4 n=1 Tax=Hordeum vulgare subsp. vulgare TaxID=112509 RepID=A0A8I7BAE6_HORVV|nr:nuclear matrix constituent protein 1b-like [Hordeum vulgare subsp. vulgare]
MASPRSPAAGAALAGDEAIWRKLREAGFDEESVRRRDKAALIAYISRLESEVYDYQHNLGLMLLERKELASKNEQLKASMESAEIMHKRERASQQSALAETRKREENLKKNVGIQKECVANLEKALHDMRAETAEIKVSYETKSAEALRMMDTAQNKFDEAEEKLLAAKSLEAECTRARNAALRSLQDMEEREDQLRRYRVSSDLEYEAKEKDISLQRKSLNDMKKMLHEKEQVLLKEQSLLNQRDESIVERLARVTQSEKKVEEDKVILEAERMALMEEKNKLDLKLEAVASREEAIIQKESLLDKRESELLILQETIANKERVEIERLNHEQEIALERRKLEFETELENKRLSFEAETETKRTLLDQRERALSEQELAFAQRDQNVDIRLAELASKEEAIARRTDELKDEEGKLLSQREASYIELQKERDEVQKMKLYLEKEKVFFEEEKREAIQAQQNLAITQADRADLLTLQIKLKEEIDNLRAQRTELLADADRLQAEKERFEIEWELFDEKKEELQKEAARITEERRVMTEYFNNQSDIIKQEKESLRADFKKNSETLSCEHEEFMSKMQQEHASWLSKIQHEREDLTRDIDNQRMELLNLAKARQMEIDADLREREKEFEQKKSMELEHINSQNAAIMSKLDHVALELQKLEDERKEANLEREKREQELFEIKNTIEALNNQREKLQEQRKLLHSDRESITEQIQQLDVLKEPKVDSQNKQLSLIESEKSKMNYTVLLPCGEVHNSTPKNCSPPKLLERKLEVSPSVSTPVSWVQKCAQVIFKRSPEKSSGHDNGRLLQNCVPKNLRKTADINGSLADELGDQAGEIPQVGGAKVSKKRNYSFSYDPSEVFVEPRRKYQRSTIQTVIGGEITLNNRPSVLEEKCSKNEYDAAPLEYGNKGSQNPGITVDSASSDDLAFANGKAHNSDFVDEDEPSEEITVSATEPATGALEGKRDNAEDTDDEEEEDEEEEEERTSSAKKLWRFLIT